MKEDLELEARQADNLLRSYRHEAQILKPRYNKRGGDRLGPSGKRTGIRRTFLGVPKSSGEITLRQYRQGSG
jgi:hypothetical protein